MDFAQQLRTRGYRLTPQRQIILETLNELGGHLTVSEVYEHVQKRVSAIDRATVYRTLQLLQELDIVHSSEIRGRTVYEMTAGEPHHHLVCEQCGRVQLLDDRHFEELVHHLMEEHQFKPNIEHVTIPGLCSACWEPEEA